MAYLSDENQNTTPGQTEDEQKTALNQSSAAEVNPKTSSGSGGLFGNAPPSSAPGTPGVSNSGQPAPTAGSSNTGFTNLSKYLDANSSQAADMGAQIASNVNNQATNATNEVNNLNTNFNSQVAAGTIPADPNAVATDISAATGIKAGGTIDPSAVAGLQAQTGANYTGPTDYTAQAGYGAASQDAANAQTAINQTKSEAGRQGLLNQQYGNASSTGYNQGESALDQALIEGNSSAQKSLAGAGSGLSSDAQNLGANANNENQAAQNAVTTDQATAAAAQAALASANSTFQGDLTSQLAAIQAANPAAYTQAQSEISNNSLDPATLASFGLTSGEHTYGMTPAQISSYLSQNNTPATLYNTATADQYAQAAALAQLGGTGAANFLPSSYASQAGTATNPYTFNTAGFNSAVAANKAAIPAEEQAVINGLNTEGQNAVSGNFSTPALQAPGGTINDSNIANAIAYYNSLPNISQNSVVSPLLAQWAGIQSALNSTVGPNGASPTTAVENTGAINPGRGNQNVVNSAPTSPSALSVVPAAPKYPSTPVSRFYKGGEVEDSKMLRGGEVSMDPLKKMAYGGMMALGGLPSVAGDKIAGPPKEPRIPKLQRPDYKLPKMPGFAEGGEVAPTNSGAPEKQFPHLSALLGYLNSNPHPPKSSEMTISDANTPPPKVEISEIPEAKYAEGGEVIGMPEKSMLAKDGISNMYDAVKDMPSPVSMPARANLSADGLSNTYTKTEEKPDPVGSPEKASLNEDGSNKYAKGGTVLDANARAHIAPKNFALPAQRKYPIENEAHARNALSRVAQFGTPEEQAVVRRQVAAHYPSIGNEKAYGGSMDNFSGIQNYLAGGEVAGTPKVPHNSYANDVVDAKLSPQEVVLPLSVTKSRDPVKAAADFMAAELAKKKNK